MSRATLFERLAPWVITVGFFVIWEIACHALNLPVYFLPPPTTVFAASWQFRWALLDNSLQTLWTTLAGFGLAVAFGLVLGILIGASRTLYAGLYPVMVGFNSIPKVAVVPILVLWFGIGTVPAILTAFLISFFPIVVNVATGLATMEPEMEDVLRALGAKKLDILLKVGIPRSLPYFFGSLKIAITLAFVGSVVSETVAANKGLGHLMLSAQASFQVPLVFAGLLALAVLGIAMYAIFAALEKRMTGWAFRSGTYAGG
jgi:NitT/TauT family transport system permease protein